MSVAPDTTFLAACRERLDEPLLRVQGEVRALVGTVMEVEGLAAPVGAVCQVFSRRRAAR